MARKGQALFAATHGSSWFSRRLDDCPLRFSSFKTVGTRSRSMRTVILAVAIGMLVFLYSRHVLLILVLAYILHGLLSRVFGMFRHRPELGEANIQPKSP